MNRIAEAFKVRPGEERMAALLVGLMLFTSAGGSIGGNGIEALFFSRFGVKFLPYMYVALGLITFITSLAITALLGRVARERLYIVLPLVLGLILVGEWALVALKLNWFYPVMWLGMNVMGSLQGLLTWGLAGAACDTRQAKRLFPLFGAGGILGAVIGGLGTRPLVNWLRAENLLLVWAVALFIAFGLGIALVGRAPAQRATRRQRPSLIVEMQQGYQFVRRSALMRWMSVAAILFSVLFFSLALPFSKAATAQFPNEDALAGFLGLFQGLSTGAAFLASLFLANRLFARLGILNSILIFCAIYLVGFGALAAFGGVFSVLVAFRFIQQLWLMGISNTAYQAVLNVIPPERRDQTRAFIDGVPGQAGTVIAGLILVIGEQALQPQQLYFIGLAAAIIISIVIWKASRAYGGALVDALRAGQPQLFFSEEEPFGGFRRDATAVAATVAGITNPDPTVRHVSAEILGHLSAPEATRALVGALDDSEPNVRAAALRALACAQASAALLDVAAHLRDPDSDVRCEAVQTVRQLAGYPGGVIAHLRPLLTDDEPSIRAHAAAAILNFGPDAEARNLLEQMVNARDTESRVHALTVLGEWDEAEAFDWIAASLESETTHPAVRRAAASALVRVAPQKSVELLIHALKDDDPSVRESVAQALGRIGTPALARTAAALSDPARETGALMALSYLSAPQAAEAIRAYAHAQVPKALRYHDFARQIKVNGGDDRLHLLIESLRDKARRHGLNALRAIGLLGDRASIAVALENLTSRDPAQRANALETLEASGERWRAVVRPLLPLWETSETTIAPVNGWLLLLLQDTDAWLRACAALVARDSTDSQVRSTLAHLARTDPDTIVRETAALSLNGGSPMDTLPTLSLMERILFLRRVPLFAGLAPADLKQVAAITGERFYPDGELIAQQGEPGDEMYIIVSGEVRVLTGATRGNDVEVARRKPGEYVGEMAIISREPRMASLVAAGDLRALCIDQKQFEGLLRERPETSLAVMRVLCARLKENQSAG
jgi:HEAT repeat protein